MIFNKFSTYTGFFLLGFCFSASAGQSMLNAKDYQYFFASEVENSDEEKIGSKNLGNDELFLGFEAPLFESIQSQWGALVSTASMNVNDYLSKSNEPTKFGIRTIWSTKSYKNLIPFFTTSVAVAASPSLPENSTALTYTVGAGFKKNIFQNFNAGLCYAVADQNSLSLESAHLYAHSFLLTIGYKA